MAVSIVPTLLLISDLLSPNSTWFKTRGYRKTKNPFLFKKSSVPIGPYLPSTESYNHYNG